MLARTDEALALRHWRSYMTGDVPLVTVAETGLFVKQADGVWTSEERTEFIDFIAANPEAGDRVPDTGGLRKLRWRRAGSGKRGGVRVIYYYHDPTVPISLLTIYAKASQADLSADEKRRISTLVTILKNAAQKGTR